MLHFPLLGTKSKKSINFLIKTSISWKSPILLKNQANAKLKFLLICFKTIMVIFELTSSNASFCANNLPKKNKTIKNINISSWFLYNCLKLLQNINDRHKKILNYFYVLDDSACNDLLINWHFFHDAILLNYFEISWYKKVIFKFKSIEN